MLLIMSCDRELCWMTLMMARMSWNWIVEKTAAVLEAHSSVGCENSLSNSLIIYNDKTKDITTIKKA